MLHVAPSVNSKHIAYENIFKNSLLVLDHS